MEKQDLDSSFFSNIKMSQIQKFKICCLTYNMHGQCPTNEELNQLLNIHKEKNFDIYAIGSQECLRSIFKSLFYSDKSKWENLLKSFFGENYEMKASVTLAAIHIIIFVKKSIRNNIRNITFNSIKTGANYNLGNKGAVGVWFTFININIMIINSHLAARKENSEIRNNSFEYIIKNMNPNFKKLDFIVFMGDLNYRLNNNKIEINKIRNDYLELLEFDQLSFEKRRIKLISNLGFKEGKINFLPTFKYRNNTDEFDVRNIKKQPAWTDRILYTKRETCFGILDVEQIEYDSMQNIIMSDHKPVYSYFNLSIRV